MSTKTIICPGCGRPNPPNLFHCKLCGTRIRKSTNKKEEKDDVPSIWLGNRYFIPGLVKWLLYHRHYGTVAGIIVGIIPVIFFILYFSISELGGASTGGAGILLIFGFIAGSTSGAIFGTLLGLIGQWLGRRMGSERAVIIGDIAGGVCGGCLLWLILLISAGS